MQHFWSFFDVEATESDGMTASLAVPLNDLTGVDRTTPWEAVATVNGEDVGTCLAAPKTIG